MPILAGTTFEVRDTGNDANAGGFNPTRAGVDRSQQDAPHVIVDGSTVTATVAATTTQVTLSGYTPTSADVGNLFRISGGAATAGWYEITGVTGNNWILDRAAGTAGQAATGRMGGALASPGQMGAAHTSIGAVRLDVWFRGSFTINPNLANVSGGRYSTGGFTTGSNLRGYGTTRGDNARFNVTLSGTVSGGAIFAITGSTQSGSFENCNMDFGGLVHLGGGVSVGGLMRNCRFFNPGAGAYAVISAGIVVGCQFDGAFARASNNSTLLVRCHINGGTPINSSLVNCIIKNSGIGLNGCLAVNCVIDSCTTVFISQFARLVMQDCWVRNCTQWHSGTSASVYCHAHGTRVFGSLSDNANNTAANNRLVEGTVTLGSDPFPNASANDYKLSAAAIAAARNAAWSLADSDLSGQANWTDVIPYSSGGSGGLFLPKPMNGGYSA